jgi:hypothetical protein
MTALFDWNHQFKQKAAHLRRLDASPPAHEQSLMIAIGGALRILGSIINPKRRGAVGGDAETIARLNSTDSREDWDAIEFCGSILDRNSIAV